MSKFTDSQRKIFIGVAIVDGLIGLVLLALSVGGLVNLPIFLPLLMLVSAAGLLIASKQ